MRGEKTRRAINDARYRGLLNGKFLAAQPIAVRPIRTLWTNFAIGIVDPFLVRASDDSRAQDKRLPTMLFDECNDLVTNCCITPNIASLGEPPLHLRRHAVLLGGDNPDSNLRSPRSIRPIKRNRSQGVPAVSPPRLLLQPSRFTFDLHDEVENIATSAYPKYLNGSAALSLLVSS